MIKHTEQYIQRFQNKGSNKSTQTPCKYGNHVKTIIVREDFAILYSFSIQGTFKSIEIEAVFTKTEMINEKTLISFKIFFFTFNILILAYFPLP